ncbi:DUF1501 domain-containing protein [Paludisphaera mucosa]|uniref:DUF1501 domain-containing protein n=1 Tax=Paludisphaera mucosa TaxID=3030827 RepID=A0ABT6F4Q4_9BACT|nr:DUF1501 domain-containing protein [Paludisphaera mucosa]MDG3002568.1 DUF1501 domain-containing protein [Paludisphaera mucosa]
MGGSTMHLDRRGFLTFAGLSWLTPAAQLLAQQAEKTDGPAGSIILLWLAGGPSQLETFDPHPDARAAGGTKAVDTAVKGIQLASGYERLAEEMGSVSLVRSMTSKEGDHERGTYMLKTGYRPDPTVVHPSIGAICCHELPVGPTDVPRHVSILSAQWPGRGGYLGGEYDAFQVDDPKGNLPDVVAPVPAARDARRALDLDVVDRAFGRRRAVRVEATLHRQAVAAARVMMSSEQLKAFDVSQEPAATLAEYGDTPFGRGCLAARRLIEVGVRCVEVTLDGWDTHVNNHEIHRRQAGWLDPAFAALIRDLRRRKLLDRTVVLCCGEFGRTPHINPFAGRDHWTNGFSLALAGGGIRPGFALGETDPEGVKDPVRPTPVADVHATILTALGLDPARENIAPLTGRPVKLSEGHAIPELIG